MAVGENRRPGHRFIVLWDLSDPNLSEFAHRPKHFDTGLHDKPNTHSTTIDLLFMAISDDGRWVVSASNSSDTAYAWDLGASNGNMDGALKPIPLKTGSTSSRYGAKFSPDGKWLVAGGSLWRMSYRGPTDGKDLETTWSGRLHQSSAFSADGRWLATSESGRGSIALWDLHAVEPTAHPLQLYSGSESEDFKVIFTNDGDWLAAAGIDLGLRLWNLKTDKPSETILHPGYEAEGDTEQMKITAMSVSPDSRWLVAGTDRGVPLIWELRSPGPTASSLPGYEYLPEEEGNLGEKARITTVEFSRESKFVVAGTANSVALMWKLSDDGSKFGNRVIFDGNDGPITFCEFGPDQKWLLTYSSSLHLWDTAETSRSTSSISLLREGSELTIASFDQTGQWLVTRTGGDIRESTPLRLWPLEFNHLMKTALRFIRHN